MRGGLSSAPFERVDQRPHGEARGYRQQRDGSETVCGPHAACAKSQSRENGDEHDCASVRHNNFLLSRTHDPVDHGDARCLTVKGLETGERNDPASLVENAAGGEPNLSTFGVGRTEQRVSMAASTLSSLSYVVIGSSIRC